MPAEPFLLAPWTQPLSCYSILIEPATEPVFDLEQAKLRAGLSWGPDDPRNELMSDFIKAAQDKVETDTGLALLTQIRDVYFTTPADGIVPLPSKCTPVQAIEDVTTATRSRRPIPLHRRVGYTAFEAPPGYTGVLRVTAGWSSAQALRTEAPLLYQAVGLMVAHYATLGRDLAITGAVASVNIIPEGYEAAIGPHRLIWLT